MKIADKNKELQKLVYCMFIFNRVYKGKPNRAFIYIFCNLDILSPVK